MFGGVGVRGKNLYKGVEEQKRKEKKKEKKAQRVHWRGRSPLRYSNQEKRNTSISINGLRYGRGEEEERRDGERKGGEEKKKKGEK